MGATAAGDGVGACADMLAEQPPEVPCADAQRGGEFYFAGLVEGAAGDAPQCPAHKLGCAHPGCWSRFALRTAAATGPESGRLRRGRELEQPDVLRERSGGAARPAVDAGRNDGAE